MSTYFPSPDARRGALTPGRTSPRYRPADQTVPQYPVSGSTSGTVMPGGQDAGFYYPYTTSSPENEAAQGRIGSLGWQQQMEADLAAAQRSYGQQEADLGNRLTYGPGGYEEMVASGGYSPTELQNMLQTGLIQGSMATPEELSNYGYMSAGEQAASLGLPWEARNTFAAGLPGVQSTFDAGKWDTRGAVGQMGADYGAAIDPSRLGLSQTFQEGYQFSPADEQAMRAAAARTVGVRSQSERDALERAAAAQGMTTPLQLQAALTRRSYAGDISAADAATNAAIQARQLGLQTTLGQEQMRLGTEQDISGRQMTAAGDVGQSRLANEQALAQQGTSLGQWGLTNLTEAQKYGEAESARRATDLAATQRQNLGNMLNTRNQQGMAAGQYAGDVYGGAANTRLTQQQLGLQGLSDQQARAQEGRYGAAGQRISAAGTGFGAASTAVNQRQQPGFWERFLKG